MKEKNTVKTRSGVYVRSAGKPKRGIKMILKNVTPFEGQHCETTATGTLLKQIDVNLSEPMLFGIGKGLGFIFWNMKIMDYPFLGGRIKPDELTKNITTKLNLKLTVKESSSIKKAWGNVKELLDQGKAVGLKLDCFHLEYFSQPVHFAGHYVAIYGYDDADAYLVDTKQQGGLVKTSLKSLESARNEKGPMSSKNLYFTIDTASGASNLNSVILGSIRENAQDYLNPPITNIGYKGILKAGAEIKNWFQNSKNIERDFCTTAMLMEKAGTGGSLFRNLYRDFLKESAALLKLDILHETASDFAKIATLWSNVSSLFDSAGKTKDIEYINKASEILKSLSVMEKSAMEKLVRI
jgi:Domain of unknown function (DUF4872)/Butirosin biosynthesis protein H, N-terminal